MNRHPVAVPGRQGLLRLVGPALPAIPGPCVLLVRLATAAAAAAAAAAALLDDALLEG